MKKLVFKLGLTSLAVLPTVAVASCSTTAPEVPTIDSEVKNFEKTLEAKTTAQSTTTQSAINTLNGSGDAQSKWTYLSTLVELPKENSNFTYEVQSAATATDSKTSIVVTIKISEKANTSNTKTAQLTISQLTQSDSALEAEVKKFNISQAANAESTKLKTSVVISAINTAQDGAKLVKLQEYTTVPTPSQGFSIKVLNAKEGKDDTSVEVVITVTEDSTTNSMETTFTVTGFTALTAQEKFDSQLALIVNQQVLDGKKGETPTQAKEAITQANLNEYYKPISLLYGVTYEYLSSEVNTATKTTLDVTLTVKSNAQGVSDKTKKVEITGFTSPQTILEEKAKLITDKPVLAAKASETATTAATAIKDDTTLASYYEKVDLGAGFSYTLKPSSAEAIEDTVKVILTVSSADTNTTQIDKPVIISGFKTLLDIEAERFAISKQAKPALSGGVVATTRQLIFGINRQTEQTNKLQVINSIVEGFPESTAGFTFEIGLASSADENPDTSTSVAVALTIKQENTDKAKEVVFTITTLTAETAQGEVDRIAAANLVNKTVLDPMKSQTANQASGAITSVETLAPYYTLVPLPKGLSYVYTSNMVDNNTLRVTMSVASSQEGINPVEKTFTISGFTSASK